MEVLATDMRYALNLSDEALAAQRVALQYARLYVADRIAGAVEVSQQPHRSAADRAFFSGCAERWRQEAEIVELAARELERAQIEGDLR